MDRIVNDSDNPEIIRIFIDAKQLKIIGKIKLKNNMKVNVVAKRYNNPLEVRYSVLIKV